MKDPDSAKFGAVTAVPGTDGTVAGCMLVNARNGFGGDTGHQFMVGVLNNGSFAVTENATLQGIRLLGICSKHGA